MKKLAEVTSVSYAVDLTLKQFLHLDKKNYFNAVDKGVSAFGLLSILESVTHAESIDFDGHFGAAVYFSLGVDYLDDAEIVANLIKMYANKRSYVDIFEASRKSTYNHRANTGFVSPFEYELGIFK